MKEKINTADATEIANLLDLLEASAEDITLDPGVLSALKIKISSLDIKKNLKDNLFKRVEKLENKQKLIKALSNLEITIVKKNQNGKMEDEDAQMLLNLLAQIESVI